MIAFAGRTWRVFKAVLVGAALTAGGCVSRGPDSIGMDRGAYIDVLATTDKEELLANIVRLAYGDPPVFFQVSSVTATPSFEYGSESEVKVGGPSVPSPMTILKPKVLVKDAPTIVYKPLLGQEFSSELLRPFEARPVFLMIENGFDFAVVAQLLFKSIGPLSNARDGSPEERAEFRHVVEALSRMIRRGDLTLSISRSDANEAAGTLMFTFAKESFESPDGTLVARGLRLDTSRREFPIQHSLVAGPASIAVNPRSLLALMSYLSNFVEVPEGHEAIIWPSSSRGEDGALIRIHASRRAPDQADVAILHRGRWFYVRADDLTSRNTLFLLRLLFNLQAQPDGDSGVQLTLPVR